MARRPIPWSPSAPAATLPSRGVTTGCRTPPGPVRCQRQAMTAGLQDHRLGRAARRPRRAGPRPPSHRAGAGSRRGAKGAQPARVGVKTRRSRMPSGGAANGWHADQGLRRLPRSLCVPGKAPACGSRGCARRASSFKGLPRRAAEPRSGSWPALAWARMCVHLRGRCPSQLQPSAARPGGASAPGIGRSVAMLGCGEAAVEWPPRACVAGA